MARDETKTGKSASQDAIALLTQDHEDVNALFERYEELVDEEASDEDRKDLAEQICTMLTVHATIEEEIFYPAARDGLDDEKLLDEAEVEHQSATDLIDQILDSEPDDALYDARVKVLGEYVRHHVEEEEGELFPLVRESDLDLDALGEEMAARKEDLLTVEEGEEEED